MTFFGCINDKIIHNISENYPENALENMPSNMTLRIRKSKKHQGLFNDLLR